MSTAGFSLSQNAPKPLKNLLANDKTTKSSCSISSKPSTMDDTNDCLFENNRMKSEELFKYEADLCEEEKFRTCFLDCSCDCSVRRKVIDRRRERRRICLRQRKSLKVVWVQRVIWVFSKNFSNNFNRIIIRSFVSVCAVKNNNVHLHFIILLPTKNRILSNNLHLQSRLAMSLIILARRRRRRRLTTTITKSIDGRMYFFEYWTCVGSKK